MTGTHLYPRAEGGTVRVDCLAEEDNIKTLARALNQTTKS